MIHKHPSQLERKALAGVTVFALLCLLVPAHACTEEPAPTSAGVTGDVRHSARKGQLSAYIPTSLSLEDESFTYPSLDDATFERFWSRFIRKPLLEESRDEKPPHFVSLKYWEPDYAEDENRLTEQEIGSLVFTIWEKSNAAKPIPFPHTVARKVIRHMQKFREHEFFQFAEGKIDYNLMRALKEILILSGGEEKQLWGIF